MRLADTLKLKPGDEVLFGDSMWTVNIDKARVGVVVAVTPRGGVKLIPLAEDRSKVRFSKWVPYHHLIRKWS